jgi:hypothetical protein
MLDYELGQTMAYRINEILKELYDDPYWYENNYTEIKSSASGLKVAEVSIKQVIYPQVEKLSEIDIIITQGSPDNDLLKNTIINKYKEKYPDSGIPNIITEW